MKPKYRHSPTCPSDGVPSGEKGECCITAAEDRGRQDERERAAKIAETHGDENGHCRDYDCGWDIARDIRRGNECVRCGKQKPCPEHNKGL